MRLTRRELRYLIAEKVKKMSNPEPATSDSATGVDSETGNVNAPEQGSSSKEPGGYQGFSVSAYYKKPSGDEFLVKFKSKSDGLGKYKVYKSDKVESVVSSLKSANAENIAFQITGLKITDMKQFMPKSGHYSQARALDVFRKLGNAIRKAVAAGRPKPEDGAQSDGSQSDGAKSDSIVKKIELALGMKDADDKWTEKETDAAWHKWVDKHKGALEKLYPGQIATLKKSWSQFSSKNKDKGVKGGASGMLTFINKKGKVKAEAPESRATLYRRRYGRY